MTKLEAQKQQLVHVRSFLVEVLGAPEDKIQRAAAIQAFELSFELSWKYIKSLVEEDAGMVASPRSAFREAAKHGYIDNPEDWFGFLEARNLTTHTYVEVLADKVYAIIKSDFMPALDKLIEVET